MVPYRILQVIPSLSRGGGVAQMMWRVYRALDRHRLQFDFLAHAIHDDFQEEIRSLGARTYCIGTLGQLGPRLYMNTLRRIIKEKGPFAAIHVHTNYQAGIVGLAARAERVSRRICHIQGTKISARNKALLPIYLLMIRLGFNIRLACNQEAGRRYFGSRPFSIIPNAIDLNEFRYDFHRASKVRDCLGVNTGDVVLGQVGRFSKEKNHVFSLDVLKEARTTGTNACLVFIGEGSLKEKVEKQARAQGLMDHVKFLGVRKDVPSMMAAFDFLLLPSLSEGQPTVLVEAQATGLPCLVSDIVTRQVDLGLGLLNYIPLSSPADWALSLKTHRHWTRIPSSRIHEAFLRSGFDVAKSAQDLTDLYEAAPK